MDLSFDTLKSDYATDLANMTPITTQKAQAEAVAKKLLVDKARFMSVQTGCGVPALWLIPVFEREGPSFSDYFGNGDPLDKPTTDVPRGRGPFETWEAGCMDALTLDDVTKCAAWTWEAACWEWEKWNGFGPREHGRPSGYLWSGTSIYKGGKYIADGVWSPGTWDQQLGTVILGKALAALDSEIAAGFTG